MINLGLGLGINGTNLLSVGNHLLVLSPEESEEDTSVTMGGETVTMDGEEVTMGT